MQTNLHEAIRYQERRVRDLERESQDIEARIGEAYDALHLLQRVRNAQALKTMKG